MPKLNNPLPILGLDVSAPAEFINTRGTPNNKNVREKQGVLETRPGSSAIGSSLGERVQRMFELESEDGSTDLLRVGLTKVELYDKGADSWSSVANSVLTGSEQDQVDYAFPLLGGSRVVTFTNGVDNIRKYTGTGNDADLGGSPPKCKFMTHYGSYLVLAYITDDGGGNALPFRVQWCDTGDIETWTGGNSGNINLVEDKGLITGCKTWGDFVTVHKSDSIYVGQLVSTSSVFRFDRKATGVGAISGKAIVTIITGEQIFLASDGIHSFNGITAPLIQSPIQDELRTQMNPAYLYKAEAIVKEEDDEVWFAVPIGSSTEPDTIYKYNYQTRQIYKDNRSNLTTLGLYLSTTEKSWNSLTGTWNEQTWRWDDRVLADSQPQIAYGFSDGVTLTEDTTTSNDNSVAVESLSDTKDFTAQDFEIPDYGVFMRFTMMEVWAKGTDMTVEYSTNSGTSWTKISDLTLSSDYPGDDSPLNLYFDVISTKIRFRFSKDGGAENFTLKKYFIEAVPRESRR